jgi:hydroxymethylbilane synthase
MRQPLRIGTRGSALALWQAGWVKARLEALHPPITIGAEIAVIKTTGDKILDVPLARVGGKGLFLKEIEEALLAGSIDLAVHSLKDVPAEIPEGLLLAAIPPREDPRDAWVSRTASSLNALPMGAVVGTSSLRRQAQILHLRPDLTVLPLRGNVETRLRKLDEGVCDAVILAAAGLHRLGWRERITAYCPSAEILPAIGQGALGVEARKDDFETLALLSPLDDPETARCVLAERAFLRRLGGGCQVPIAGHAALREGRLTLEGLVASPDGRQMIRQAITGPPSEGEALGIQLAERILEAGGREILEELYQ